MRPKTPLFWTLGATILVSALLLFSVQPYVGRLLLPALGGVPAAWTACLFFFQGVLLAGYGWGYALARVPSRGVRVGLHLALLGGATLALPPSAPPLDPALATDAPVLFALVFLVRAVGLPFFALTTTAPMLQAWLADSDDPARAAPYPLYAASNAGSLLSLLAYPLLVEPLLTLSEQGTAFSVGFVLMLALAAASGTLVMRRGNAPPPSNAAQGSTRAERLTWLTHAFVPAGLLATFSSYLAMDLAPVPLLWILPLAIYLGSFVVAFGQTAREMPQALSRVARLLAAALVVATGVHANSPLWLLVALHFAFFAAATLVIHRRLARSAPAPAFLTDYYLTTALGGVLGTLVLGILPTLLLPDTWEHALAIAAAAGLTLAPAVDDGPTDVATGANAKKGSPWRTDLLHAGVVLALALGLVLALPFLGLGASPFAPLLVFGAPVLLSYRQSMHPRRYASCLVAIVLAGTTYSERGTALLRRERDFFGVLRVVDDGGRRVLLHGTTLHGEQALSEARGCEPLAYYAREGPLGRAIAARRAAFASPISASAIGLGAGATACYAARGETWTFHEISAAVVAIASDPSLFTYVSNAAGEITLRIDDGRVGLSDTAAASRDLVIVDAFNSDSVPVHLLTTEAIRVYLRALRPDGWLMVHVSNRSLDLVRVVSALVRELGIAARVNSDASEVGGDGSQPSWIVIGTSDATLVGLDGAAWVRLPETGARAWSDERSSLLDALR